MARDINQRLQALRARRTGEDRTAGLAYDQLLKVYADAASTDIYEKRAANQTYTKYALGAMQEVGPAYTRVSVETAERVGNHLSRDLKVEGLAVEFRLQGSVPANIHIRGFSDVDLLVLRTDFWTYSASGWWAKIGHYTSPSNRTTGEVLTELRTANTKILRNRFPAAKIDTSGGKAIKISEASLPRPVDVVASHWHDTDDYQSSRKEVDRGVTLYDKKTTKPVKNLPFRHIQLLADGDSASSGGLKKAIRLAKNVKCDADAAIELSSFDISSLLYHADLDALKHGATRDLAVLAETQRFFDYLFNNPNYAKSLLVPDGTRLVLDSDEKVSAVTLLSMELDALASAVAKEQSLALRVVESAPLTDARRVLREAYIPYAPAY